MHIKICKENNRKNFLPIEIATDYADFIIETNLIMFNRNAKIRNAKISSSGCKEIQSILERAYLEIHQKDTALKITYFKAELQNVAISFKSEKDFIVVCLRKDLLDNEPMQILPDNTKNVIEQGTEAIKTTLGRAILDLVLLEFDLFEKEKKNAGIFVET